MVGGLKEDSSGEDGTNDLSHDSDVAQNHRMLIDLAHESWHPARLSTQVRGVSALNLGFVVRR
jgi:hypothetical protein